MSVPQGVKETLLWKKATELVEKIQVFSDRILDSEFDIYSVSKNLRRNANDLQCYIEDSYSGSSKTSRNKNAYLAEVSVSECINCLNQAERLHLGEPSELIKSANQVHEMLKDGTLIYNHTA